MNRKILKIAILSLCFILTLKLLANMKFYYIENESLTREQMSCLREDFNIKLMPGSKMLIFYPSQRGDLGLRYEFGFVTKAGSNETFNYYDSQLKRNDWVLTGENTIENNEYIIKKYKKKELNGVAFYIRKYKKRDEYRVGIFIDYNDKKNKDIYNSKKIKDKPFYAGWTSLLK